MRTLCCICIVAGIALFSGVASAADTIMGDYEGTWKAGDKEGKLVAQVIALGDGQYRANLLEKFDTRDPKVAVLKGALKGEKAVFSGKSDFDAFEDSELNGTISEEKFTGAGGDASFEMERIVRKSPTLAAKPPAGAIVLFDGTSTDQWVKRNGKPSSWKLVDGAMEVSGGGVISKRKFNDIKLHLEFRAPFKPKARGQGRGNSGVYLQGRYEVQVLDSYGLEGRSNECGGIYGVGAPRVNMCFPPMQWQTYDMTFRAPRFDENGKKTAEARITVKHNGVKIHDNVEVPKMTTAHWGGDPAKPAGIHLQDHGNPVQYRNIWVIELEED